MRDVTSIHKGGYEKVYNPKKSISAVSRITPTGAVSVNRNLAHTYKNQKELASYDHGQCGWEN
jgi:hypothetical protein